MLKIIIGLFVIGIILYTIFGVWGIIIPAVLFVGIIILAIKNADKTPIFPATSSNNSNSGPSFAFDTEIDVGNIPMSIKYKDKEGTATDRKVEIKKIGIAGTSIYVRGFCRMAKGERTFKVDRIIEAKAHGKSVNPMVFISGLCKDREEFKKVALSGINFCITGTLGTMKRREAQEKIEKLGGKFHKYLRYDTHFLVAEDTDYHTGKLLDAQAEGIPIIDELKFLEYLDNPEKAYAEKQPTKKRDDFNKMAVTTIFSIHGITTNIEKRPVEPEKPSENTHDEFYYLRNTYYLPPINAKFIYSYSVGGIEKEVTVHRIALTSYPVIHTYSKTDKSPRTYFIRRIKKFTVNERECDPIEYLS